MQCVSDLAKLRDDVTSRVQALRQIAAPISIPPDPEGRRALAFVTVELDNLIIVALRQYTKSCLLRSRTAAGVRVNATVAPATPEEAAAYVYSSVNPAGYAKINSPSSVSEKDEIAFRDPKRAEKVLIDFQASNIANLQLALSLNATVFSELKICRHFFSHRMMNTADQVRQLANNVGITHFKDTENFIAQGRPSTGVRFVDGWLSEVENFFDLAA